MERDATRRCGYRGTVIVLRLRRQPRRGADPEARRWALGWLAWELGAAGVALFSAYLAIAS